MLQKSTDLHFIYKSETSTFLFDIVNLQNVSKIFDFAIE